MFLRSGIKYQNRKNRHKIEGLLFGNPLPLTPTKASIQNDILITSIGIPVDLGYSINSKNEKISYVIGIGGVINLNLNTRTEAKVLYEERDSEQLSEAVNVVDE